MDGKEPDKSVPTVIGVGALPQPGPAQAPPDQDSVLALHVVLPPASGADRANDDEILGPSLAPPPQPSEPEIYRSPVVVDVPIWRRVLTPLDEFFSPPVTRRKLLVVGGGLSVSVLLLAVLLAKSPDTESKNTGLVASSTPSPGAAPTVAPLVALPHKTSRNTLRVAADGPIGKVTIGERVIAASLPSTSLDVDLTDAERNKPMRMTVTGTDGRIALVTVDPSMRGVEVALEEEPVAVADPFPTEPALPPPPDPAQIAPPPVPVVHGATAPKEKRTWPRRQPKK